MPLITLVEIKTAIFGPDHTIGDEHDPELTRMRGTAISNVEDLLGSTTTALWPAGDVPDRVNQAVLRHVQWQWSRAHGGSESYMPGGDDSVVGLSPQGIRRELEFLLGHLTVARTAPVFSFPGAADWPTS